jgi:UDPglucose--hexose-1-phosphate uridylyltransferase
LEKRRLLKPDGRELILYARRRISADIAATSPPHPPLEPRSHLRWHPLRGEWVVYATHRQDRTFEPGADANPLAPTRDPERPTELPEGEYDVAVFANLFPAFTPSARDAPAAIVPTRPATGECEVVVYARDPHASLGALPLDHLELLLEVWADRTRELGAREEVRYVFPFENRGAEVGVTLSHPHGQIYAYPFVPPIPARELEQEAAHRRAHGTGLLETLIAAELRDGRRILAEEGETVAFVPACARYAYEVWIATRSPIPSLDALDGKARHDFARALRIVLRKYDRLWSRPFPYVMAFHQAPTDGAAHPEAHLHVEFYPPHRNRERLKYLAGSELGAGVFTADTLPEDRAAELRAVAVGEDAGHDED